MPFKTVIPELGLAYDTTNRFNSEMFTLNLRLNEGDPIMTLADYRKAKATFRILRTAMADLDRAILKISESIPSTPPDHGIDS